MEKTKHISVLLKEAVAALNVQPGGSYLDATLGGGGHSNEILKQMGSTGTLVACDQDPEALRVFQKIIEGMGYVATDIKQVGTVSYKTLTKSLQKIFLVHANFSELPRFLSGKLEIGKINGVLADLGLSTDQLLERERGFSYLAEGKLDMRMNPRIMVTAANLLNGLYEKELEELFRKYGDVEFSVKLARAVVRARNVRPFVKVRDLKQIVQKIVPLAARLGASKHPEAKVFQALRIAVNDELNSLKQFLPQALEILAPGGRIAVITFHSGEDRIVKNDFRDAVNLGKAEYLHKILLPEASELERNQRSHSAKLRAIIKK